jgi:hypothetical protein
MGRVILPHLKPNQMTYQEKPPFDLGQFLTYLIVFFVLVFIICLGTGCGIEKKIEAAKKEAVRADRAEHPCANDTIFRLVPGEQLILTDTVQTIWHDSLFNWTYDTAYITKTIHKVDTIKAFIRDDYKINSLNDSINVHKQSEANLQGQIIQEKLNTIEANKTAKNRLYILIALCSLIAISFGVGVYFKVSTIGLKNLIK